MEYLAFTLNTGAALLMGSVLGFERQYGGHPAGLRTNALVSVGSALFVSVGYELAGTSGVDPTRIASYVVSGIGFLGGGVIMREGLNVRGMNTAATLWCSAAIGVLCGQGLVLHALLGAFFVLIINLGLRPLVHWIDMRRKLAPDVEVCYRLQVVCQERDQGLVRAIVLRHINSRPRMTIHGIATQETDQAGHATVVAEVFSLERNDRALDEVLGRLNIEPGVLSVSWEKKS
jgi:putative Mg2+ transporter-C (MgtC) family protein